MNILKLLPRHHDTIIAKMLDLKRQIVYHEQNVKPHYDDMKPYEKKQYEAGYNENVKNLKEYSKFILKHKTVFSGILSQYGLTVAAFIRNYISK